MKIPFFASFIIFIVWLSYEISKTRRITERTSSSFWEKEARANNTRRQPLDDLNYITIPFEQLPMNLLSENERITEYHETLRSLSDSPIVNLTGISNTDLKLKYGAPNIDLLMKYDQNYTSLVRTLQKWAEELYGAGYTAETQAVLEFALSTNTDVSGTYRLLAQIYSAQGHQEKIDQLREKANQLPSGSQKIIARILQEFCR